MRPIGWTEDRTCPRCQMVFTVDSQTARKRYCTRPCAYAAKADEMRAGFGRTIRARGVASRKANIDGMFQRALDLMRTDGLSDVEIAKQFHRRGYYSGYQSGRWKAKVAA